MVQTNDNYKERLLHYYQRNFDGQFPVYDILREEGPTNDRVFEMGVMDPAGRIVGRGIGTKKKEAEQKASRAASIYFKQIDPELDTLSSRATSTSEVK